MALLGCCGGDGGSAGGGGGGTGGGQGGASGTGDRAQAANDYPSISFRNLTIGHAALIENTKQSPFTARLVLGTCDAFYAGYNVGDPPSSNLPINVRARLRCFTVP